MNEEEVRPCGGGWQYCNGDCSNCTMAGIRYNDFENGSMSRSKGKANRTLLENLAFLRYNGVANLLAISLVLPRAYSRCGR